MLQTFAAAGTALRAARLLAHTGLKLGRHPPALWVSNQQVQLRAASAARPPDYGLILEREKQEAAAAEASKPALPANEVCLFPAASGCTILI